MKTIGFDKQEKAVYLIIIIVLAGLVLTGFIHQGLISTLEGFVTIQRHPGRLINDFTAVGGTGAALVNASLTALIGLILVRLSAVKLSGPTVAAVFTILGFGLFGKTPLNILPIILGVWISARLIGKTLSDYILIALFGTALGPFVSFLVLEFGLTGIAALVAGFAFGVFIGILLPPIAMAMLHLHQGYNLYNMGLTCGFIGLFAAAVISASGGSVDITVIWNKEPPRFLILLIPVLSVFLITAGFLLGGKKTLKDMKAIMKHPGRLPSDFMDMVSPAGALLNMGLLGFGSWAYVLIVGGDFNGPVLGGILTIVGFSAFGKHPRNVWPVMAGVVISCLVFGKDLTAPGPLLAALFVTTLAPLSGQFGPAVGILAGFLHLVLVERTAPWHGGMDLYNNGFAGGLTAALLVAVIEWVRTNKPARVQSRKAEVKIKNE